jgi:hypothetical protein
MNTELQEDRCKKRSVAFANDIGENPRAAAVGFADAINEIERTVPSQTEGLHTGNLGSGHSSDESDEFDTNENDRPAVTAGDAEMGMMPESAPVMRLSDVANRRTVKRTSSGRDLSSGNVGARAHMARVSVLRAV